MTDTKTSDHVVVEESAIDQHRRPRAAVILTVLLSLACLGLVATGGALIEERGKTNDLHGAEQSRTTALSVAKRYAVDFSTYDHTSLDATFKKVSAELTGDFKTQYLATSASLKATLEKYRGKAVATVQGAGVTSATNSKAVVVVLIDQTVTSAASRTPRIDRSRMVITLERVKGRWLMANLDLK